MLNSLTKESWSPYLEQEFQLHIENAKPLSMTLVEVTGLGDKPGQTREPFSLIFSGPEDLLLDQAIYPLQHEELGSLDIFLVPVGPGREGMHYEAVFT